MTITTLDGVIAGARPPLDFNKAPIVPFAAKMFSLWPVGGQPGPGGYNGTINGGTYSTSSSVPAGSMPRTDATSGKASYLSRFIAGWCGASNAQIWLCDRIWDNTPVTIGNTSLQSITSGSLTTRDNVNGSNGIGSRSA